MHLHFEQNISSRTECVIHSLSWMGKVPDSPSGDTTGAWKLSRGQYYSEGWLACGNHKGVVGVTFTTSHCNKYEPPQRCNFNLRGHRSPVILVCWNEPYQKLATCDSQGIIFVWIKHEGRWSIELINDRNAQVTDFAWSHDGRMALICYCDGFVLVGSVAGHRYWSTMLNLDGTLISCGVWDPGDDKVVFGKTDGQLIVMSSTGAMLTQVTVWSGVEITSLHWSCQKFNMEENPIHDSSVIVTPDKGHQVSPEEQREHTLAVSFDNGTIFFMHSYDDPCPRIVHTNLTGLTMDWSNCGKYLAVGGFTRLPDLLCLNEVHFYTIAGDRIRREFVPSPGKALSSLCWGHNDARLFVSAGHNLHVARVVKHVPSLQFLCQRSVQLLVHTDQLLHVLPLPSTVCSNIKALFAPTLKSYIPDPFKLRGFVSTPPPGAERMFCTMIHHGEEPSGGHYTLYLEYLGGLIPLLKGKRASKLRPDFIIFDPKIKATGLVAPSVAAGSDWTESSTSDSDVEVERCGGSPRVTKRKCQKQFRPNRVQRSTTFRTLNDLFYNDNLPESSKLVEVLSNIWGTKFRIVGTAAHLPEDLGSVLYKTSLLHLQPRQMTVTVTELPRDETLLAQDPQFTPTGYGEETQNDGLGPGAHNENWMSSPHGSHGGSPDSSEILTVDLLTEHLEMSCGNMAASTSLTYCLPERQISVCMKTKLSPASETHPQNNQAFNISHEAIMMDAHSNGGARPKVPLYSPFSNHFVNESSNAGGLTISSNYVNSKQFSPVDSSSTRSSISSHSEHSIRSPLPDTHNLQNSAIVGDFFLSRLSNEGSQVNTREQNVHSRPDHIQTGINKHGASFVDRYFRSDYTETGAPRWADPACHGLKFADEDDQTNRDPINEGNIVHDSSNVLTPSSQSQKRLILDSGSEAANQTDTDQEHKGHIGSLAELTQALFFEKQHPKEREVTNKNSMGLVNIFDTLQHTNIHQHESAYTYEDIKYLGQKRKPSLLSEFERKDITQTTSLPSSPLHRIHEGGSSKRSTKEGLMQGKCKHYSPIFKKKSSFNQSLDTSDTERVPSLEDIMLSSSYKNLESFQKAHLKQKLID
ncbi:tubby-related protein 4-like isoform X2 [Dreissena polymorpha]|uniref:tubby-related protein 4-like isoform X2 n=1 Tax=Dreissena polymorpha TaxID=45954 RepID=UPI00226413B0|nr:tubby-related protein 4-like isoform X2 [Dreissena polymorpha]